jgi:hypothetical protein
MYNYIKFYFFEKKSKYIDFLYGFVLDWLASLASSLSLIRSDVSQWIWWWLGSQDSSWFGPLQQFGRVVMSKELVD